MRWEGREESENVRDRRRMPVSGGVAVGGGLGMLVLALIIAFMGGDPRALLEQAGQNPQAAGGGGEVAVSAKDEAKFQAQEPLVRFVKVVVKDTEDVWTHLAPEIGQMVRNPQFQYKAPFLDIFNGTTTSRCGTATAAVGPFYCPADETVYIDLDFFQELQQRFKAPGDFAMAYVIAHEVGHHVQNQVGLSAQVQRKQASLSKEEGNQWSVRLELQADYLAGVWAHHAQKMKDILERGDLEEALNAASRIGDDVLQKQATGHVRPDGFTHGTAKQRVYWLRAGLKSGDLSKMMEPFELEYEDL